MDNVDVKLLLKSYRIRRNISNIEISQNTFLSSANVSKIENKFSNNSVIEYVKYLRLKGIDLNKLFDEILEK